MIEPIPMTLASIGRSIQTAINNSSITQKDAATLIDISHSYFQRLCAGSTRLSPQMAVRLEKLSIDGERLYLCQALGELRNAKLAQESQTTRQAGETEISSL